MHKQILKHALLVEILLILAAVELIVNLLTPWLMHGSEWPVEQAVHLILLAVLAGPLIIWRSRMRISDREDPILAAAGLGRGLLLPAVLLILGLSVTGWAAWNSWRGSRESAQMEFAHLTDRLVESIRQRMVTFEHGLYGTRGAFVVSDQVDRDEFRRYAASRADESDFPGVLGYGFIERVPRERLAEFVASTQADGAPDFEVTTSGDRPDLLVIKFLETELLAKGMIGLDFGSIPSNRIVAEAAVDTGRPTLTEFAPSSANGYGFLLPVYRNGKETGLTWQRREALIGYVYIPVRLEAALTGLASHVGNLLDFHIFDAPLASDSKLMYDSDPATSNGVNDPSNSDRAFRSTQTITVGGRPWTIETCTTEAFEERLSLAVPGGIAAAGSIISGLLASVAFTMGRSRSRAMALAEGMTTELRASEHRANEARESVERAMAELTAFQAAMDEHAIIAVTDLAGTILHVNDLFCRISGYSRQELIGKNHRLLNSGTHPRTFWTEMYRTVAKGCVWHAEVCNRAKDGSLYWVDTTIAPIRSASGKLDRFVAIRADLTERKRAEERLIASERQARDLALIAEKTSNAAVVTDAQGRITWVNDAFTRITEYNLDEVRGRKPGSFLQGPKTDPETIERIRAAIASRQRFVEEIYNYAKSGREYWLQIDATPVFDDQGELTHFIAVETDIHERKMSELLRAGQARVLELAAARAPLTDVLAEVCSVVEEQCTGAAAGASVMLAESGRLRSAASGSLPREYCEAVDGVAIGPTVGSCGAAAYLGREWITSDMDRDPNWSEYRRLTSRFGLAACWSVPILASSGETLGSVALYHSVPSTPTEDDLRLLREVARLAALAIEQSRTEERMKDVMADVIRARDESERRGVELATRAKEMELLRDRAEQATAAKSAFLANMSHEIRTPLTAILGYADLLRDDGDLEAAPQRRLQTLETIRAAGQHLLTVINDILDLSKIEADKMTVEHVEAELPAILHEVESLMRPRTGQKGVRLATHLETPIPERIISDPTRLRQILMNLVGNAVKFTDHGSVTISAKVTSGPAGERLLVDVTDTGSGLSDEQIKRLFSPFSQADDSVTRKHGGTGLGLTICRRLADLMGGSVTLVRSERDVGSCFRVDLPLVPVAGVRRVLSLGAVQPGDAADGAAAAVTQLTGRILLAEDGADNQRLIAFHLRKAGATVEVAENGLIALRMIEAAAAAGAPYDLLLTDMQMPEMDGYSLARTLRTRGSGLAVVALTAHAMAEDRTRCRQAGCDDYATKPIDRVALLATCARWIGKPGGVGYSLAAS
jgi:PAS domain S-box-containing protein